MDVSIQYMRVNTIFLTYKTSNTKYAICQSCSKFWTTLNISTVHGSWEDDTVVTIRNVRYKHATAASDEAYKAWD